MGGFGGLTRFWGGDVHCNPNTKVKGVGQECPTHTSNFNPTRSEFIGFGGVYGGEVAFAGVYAEFVTAFFGLDVDGAVLAVAFEESGFVGNQVAAADDLLQFDQTAVEAANRAWGEVSSTGEFGYG